MQNENLKQLVGKRYSWDTVGFEVIPEVKKEITPQKKSEKNLSKQEDKEILAAEKEYKEALAYIKDMIAPAYMKVFPDKVKLIMFL